MKRLLITGAAGQLGQALDTLAQDRFVVHALTSAELDITDADQVDQLVQRLRPDALINAAAYTAVDRAEAEPQRAQQVNADGAGHLAAACARVNARLIQVSTDFVFDGQARAPYPPDAPMRPLSRYGASKRDGELAVMAALTQRCTIVRTAWVYGPGGQNFVATMLRLLRQRSELGVVMDQIGSPTCTLSLAEALLQLLESGQGEGEVLHFTDAGVASWYDFACAVRELAASRWPDEPWGEVKPIYTVDYPTPAVRPAYSVLDCRRTQALGIKPRHWRTVLAEVLGQI